MAGASVSARRAVAGRWPAGGRGGVSSLRPAEALLAVALAAWTTAVLIPEAPWAQALTLAREGWAGILVVPAALAAGLLLRPRDRALLAAATAAGIVLALQWGIPRAARDPLIALALPALCAAAAVAARRPVAILTAALALCGFAGTLEAHTPLPPRVLADGLLLALVLALLWQAVVDRRAARPVRIWPAVVLFAAYVLASVLAAVGAPDQTAAWQGFRSSQLYMLAALLVGVSGWDGERRLRAARALVAIAVAVGAYALFRDLAGASDAERDLALATLGRYNLLDGELRLVGSFATAADLAAWSVVAAPFSLALALALRGPWRWVAALAFALSTYALIATGVRTTVVGLALAVVLVIALFALGRGFRGPRLLVAGGALVIALLGGGAIMQATALTSPEARERFERLLDPGNDESLQGRQRKWRAALDDAGDRPLGSGLGTSGGAAIRYATAADVNRESIDSAYLKVFVEQGPVGLALFAGALLGLLATLAHAALRARSPGGGALLVGGAAMLAGAFVIYYAGVFSEGLTSMLSWLVLGLALSELGSPDT